MTSRAEQRLADLGLGLPEPVTPLAAYVPFVQIGDMVYVSGQIPMDADGVRTGHLSEGDAIDAAKDAAQLCALNLLAQVKACVGDLDRVKQVVKLTGFVSSAPGFTQHPQVVNGASELMVNVFEDAGKHTRAAVGAPGLPLGSVVEVEGLFQVT